MAGFEKLIEPWYGSWPPEVKGEADMFLGKCQVPIWAIMLVVLVISITGWAWIDSLNKVNHSLFYEMLGRLCEALAIAAILGATVDGFLKSAIVKDVFEASLGYLLPEELKPEMEWIYGQNIICEDHFQEYTLTPIDSEYLNMDVYLERRFRNFGNKAQHIRPTLSIDDWFHKTQRSAIFEFGYRNDDHTEMFEGDKLKTEDQQFVLKLGEQKEVILEPGKSATFWFKFREIKHLNDANYIVFAYPTKNPRIKINCPPALGLHFGFAHRGERQDSTSGVFRLDGTLLPHQHIMIRWWDKTFLSRNALS